MNINKAIAEEVAHKLLLKIDDKIIDKYAKLSMESIEIYLSLISEIDKKFLIEIPKKWIEQTTRINFKSPTQFYNIYVDNNVPKNQDDSYTIISEDQINYLQSLEKDIVKLKEKKKTLKNQIVAQLLKLRTFNKVEKEFPEAFIYLPEINQNNLPAIQITDILNQIKNI